MKIKPLNSLIATLVVLLINSTALAEDVAMADEFREQGKIYVVVAVLITILTGFFVYLFLIDRKTQKLEEKIKELTK